MTTAGDILLVSCYELGHQPLNLASPLAALAEAGFQPRAIDTAVASLTDEAIAGAGLVAISVPMHTALRLAVAVAEQVRAANPRAHLTMYGLYAWLNAEYLFEQGLADSVIGGEFEEPLISLARTLTAGGRADGVRYPDRYASPRIARQSFAQPRREALPPLARYAGLERDGEVVTAGYVEASRGCKHTCSHCPITPVYGGRFFVLPQDVVLQDVRAQVHAGAQHITFGDPDFLNGPTHSLKIVRAMHAEFPGLTFDATIKIEHILRHAQIFPELKELGCAFVVSAVESLSDTVLARLRKGHTGAQVSRALDVMAEACIPLRPSLVSFTPWTSLDDYRSLLRFVEARGLVECVDPVQYTIRLLIPPGSALLQEPDTAEWLGTLDAAAFSYRWRHADARMDALHAEVSGIVERGEIEHREVRETFAAVKAAAGLDAAIAATPSSARPPRLTESWFC